MFWLLLSEGDDELLELFVLLVEFPLVALSPSATDPLIAPSFKRDLPDHPARPEPGRPSESGKDGAPPATCGRSSVSETSSRSQSIDETPTAKPRILRAEYPLVPQFNLPN